MRLRAVGLLRFIRNQAGVAAIEMALIFPVVLILYVGMVDLTALLLDHRKLENAVTVVADSTTQLDPDLTPAAIDDVLRAADIVMRTGQHRVEVHNYRLHNGNPVLRWSRSRGTGPNCTDPSQTGLASLMTDGNDVLIAVICEEHTPVISGIIGESILGSTQFTVRRQIAMRPRHSLTLPCPTC